MLIFFSSLNCLGTQFLPKREMAVLSTLSFFANGLFLMVLKIGAYLMVKQELEFLHLFSSPFVVLTL